MMTQTGNAGLGSLNRAPWVLLPGRTAWGVAAALCLLLLTLPVRLEAKTVGSLNLSGDKHLDSDRLATQEQPPRRWLSFPGGRLCLNPSSSHDFAIKPLTPDLPLEVGGYVGTRVLRLPETVTVCVCPGDKVFGAPPAGSTAQETWYPYKLAYQANYPAGAQVSGYDFFLDPHSTLIRVLAVQGGAGQQLRLTGRVGGESAIWDAAEQALLVSGSDYCYALRFVGLAGKGLSARPLSAMPQIQGTNWTLSIALGAEPTCYGISMGFAVKAEGQATAIQRAKAAFAQPVEKSLASVKAAMDRRLRQVPAPTAWGLQQVDAKGITPERQRQAYYMAWTFLFQSTMDPLPENPAYPYPQMSLGKGALWAEGEHACPATCGWESFLGIQWLAFVEPKFGWQAYEGIMSRIDAQGRLGGESLPSRKAQTAWILYQQSPDKARLAALYPALVRYLLWRERNPRWIYGKDGAKDEKDLEFVVSWLNDVEYAARIAGVLGLQEDAQLWPAKAQAMVANMCQWFFSDPKELHQLYFANKGVYSTPQRNEVRPIMILTALNVPDLPADMADRLKELFVSIHQPSADNDGFNYLKYPDNNLVAYGLLNRRLPQAQAYLQTVLRDCIRGGEFAETLETRNGKGFRADGVKPSVFNAMNIIEFTWLLNGVRYDSGKPAELGLPRGARSGQ